MTWVAFHFNQYVSRDRLQVWSVQSAANFAGAFASTPALSDCNKRSIYDAWGTTFQKEYPDWKSLPLCLPGQWTTARNMPTYQRAFAWAYESSRLVLIGGQNPTAPAPSEVLNAVYVLNPATDAWTSKKSMPSTRYGRAAHALACVV